MPHSSSTEEAEADLYSHRNICGDGPEMVRVYFGAAALQRHQIYAGGGHHHRAGGDALRIRDTGIGIALEDAPDFEKGYTGGNGRIDRSASDWGCIWPARRPSCCTFPSAWRAQWG